MHHPEGYEPTTITSEPPRSESSHFAPSDYDRLAEALPELERIQGISRDWLSWYEDLTVRMGRATGATDQDE